MPLIRELDPGASPLAFFGAELRRARTAAGLSQEQLGQRLGYSGDLVGKVETAERSASQDFVKRCDQALPGADGLFARLNTLIQRWEGGYPSWFAEWVEAERRATALSWWEPLVVPGLVQTAEYARAILAGGPDTMEDELDQMVAARMERQTTEKSSAVAQVTRRLDALRAVALPRDDSRDLILKVAEERWSST